MAILDVLNVGQGDSMILNPPSECCFENMTIFVDLGPGQVDVTKYIKKKENDIHIFITHHDADHLNGLKFFVDRMGKVSEITVPFYQNEITLIAKCILSLKGMRNARDCGEFINLLEDVLEGQIYLKKLTREIATGPQLSFAYEGKNFCDHIICLNPPVTMDTFRSLNELSIQELSALTYELFEPDFARSMEIYFRVMASDGDIIDSREIFDITLNDSLDNLQINADVYRRKGAYVADFIFRNLDLFRLFNSAPKRETLRAIYKDFIKCAHDACMVLRANYWDKIFLLAGDASKKVFNRLISEGTDISADYLKMPHHGSIQNISKGILDKIQPDAAIISHNNRRFGKAKDTHPNMKVLNILQEKGIRIMLTNDVYKNGKMYMRKASYSGDQYVDIL